MSASRRRSSRRTSTRTSPTARPSVSPARRRSSSTVACCRAPSPSRSSRKSSTRSWRGRRSREVTSAVAPLVALAGGWTATALFVHLRGRERLAFMRQVADHSTFLAPYNAFVYLFSGVPNRPMLDVGEFPALRPLQAGWQTIREEALALHRAGHLRKAAKHDDLAFKSFYRRAWRRFYVKWYGATVPSARSLCPRTAALVAEVPSVHAAMFALLAPRSHLVRHRDPFAGSLRYHLGLVVPEG